MGRQIIAKNDSICLLPVVVEPSIPVLPIGFGWVWVGLGRSYGFWVGLGWYFRERMFTWVVGTHGFDIFRDSRLCCLLATCS